MSDSNAFLNDKDALKLQIVEKAINDPSLIHLKPQNQNSQKDINASLSNTGKILFFPRPYPIPNEPEWIIPTIEGTPYGTKNG